MTKRRLYVFQFSEAVPSRAAEDYWILEAWAAHFLEHGIACGIVKSEYGSFALWRAGRRRREMAGDLQSDNPAGRLDTCFGGFCEVWLALGGELKSIDIDKGLSPSSNGTGGKHHDQNNRGPLSVSVNGDGSGSSARTAD